MSALDEIRARDAESGATWFTGPASFTAQSARDRRALLAEMDRLIPLARMLVRARETLRAIVTRLTWGDAREAAHYQGELIDMLLAQNPNDQRGSAKAAGAPGAESTAAPTNFTPGAGVESPDGLRLHWLAETMQMAEDDFGACNWNRSLLEMVMERFKKWRRLPPNDALDALRKAIDTQVVHKTEAPEKWGGWVPLAERLPTNGAPCLCAVRLSDDRLGVVQDVMCHAHGVWEVGSARTDYPFPDHITHWMPLPAGPNEPTQSAEPVMHRRALDGVMCDAPGPTRSTTIESAVTCAACREALRGRSCNQWGECIAPDKCDKEGRCG